MNPIASRDQNRVTTMMAVSSVDGVTPVLLYADPVTHRLLVDTPAGSVSATSVTTFTNKRIVKRVGTTASGSTVSINIDDFDLVTITALATNLTALNLSGTATNGQNLWVAITDNGTPRTLAFGSSFEASGTVALPTTTVAGVRLDIGFVWNAATSKFRCVAVA